MSDELKPGTSSPKVLTMQKMLNKALPSMGLPLLKENGEYDEATQCAVAAFQERANVGYTFGAWDAKTQAALVRELAPKYIVTVDGKKYCLTSEQLQQVQVAAGARAAAAIENTYVNMAREAMIYWQAHDTARRDNWFWSNAIEAITSSKFPDKGTMDQAVAAADAMKAAAASGKMQASDLSAMSAPIRDAFALMDQYRGQMFDGGQELVANLEMIKGGCVTSLKVLAVFVPGGTLIQVGIAAGLGGYEELVKQISTAPNNPKVTAGDAALSVFVAAAVDGAVQAIMKGKCKGLEKFTFKVAKEAIKKASADAFEKALMTYLTRAMNGAGKKLVEDALKGLGRVLLDPNYKVTEDKIVDAAIEAVISGMAVGVLGPAAGKWAKGASSRFSAADFTKFLGKGDYAKAMKDGLQGAIDKAAGGAVNYVLENWVHDKNPATFDDEVKAKILQDKAVQAAAAKAKE